MVYGVGIEWHFVIKIVSRSWVFSIEIIDIECGLLSRVSPKIVANKMADL